MAEKKSKKETAASMLVRKSGATAAEIKERLKWNDDNVTKFMFWVKLFAEVGALEFEVETKSTGEEIYKIAPVASPMQAKSANA